MNGDVGFDLGDLEDRGLRVAGLRARDTSIWDVFELRFSEGGAEDFGILKKANLLLYWWNDCLKVLRLNGRKLGGY